MNIFYVFDYRIAAIEKCYLIENIKSKGKHEILTFRVLLVCKGEICRNFLSRTTMKLLKSIVAEIWNVDNC